MADHQRIGWGLKVSGLRMTNRQLIGWGGAGVGLLLLPVSLVAFSQGLPTQAISLNLSKILPARWLEVTTLTGDVKSRLGGQPLRLARSGDRLTRVGDRVTTGSKSESVLAVDQSAAIVRLSEGTIAEVQKLEVDAKGGHITILSVPKGLARLQVRPFNRPTSRLDIVTPAGVAGVRGTEYGVVVNPNGKSTIATQAGTVAASAQGQTELVRANQYSLIIPGKPPTPPQSLGKDLKLSLLALSLVDAPADAKPRQARIVAQVHPSSAVWVNDEMVNTDTNGNFEQVVDLPADAWISVLVRSPLGDEQLYKLYVSPIPLTAPTTLGAVNP